MTPEELNRTVEFLLQHQAQFSVRVERDHAILAQSIKTMTELIVIESSRLDRHDEAFRKYEEGQQEFQRNAEKRHQEAMRRLDRILDRLTDRTN